MMLARVVVLAWVNNTVMVLARVMLLAHIMVLTQKICADGHTAWVPKVRNQIGPQGNRPPAISQGPDFYFVYWIVRSWEKILFSNFQWFHISVPSCSNVLAGSLGLSRPFWLCKCRGPSRPYLKCAAAAHKPSMRRSAVSSWKGDYRNNPCNHHILNPHHISSQKINGPNVHFSAV